MAGTMIDGGPMRSGPKPEQVVRHNNLEEVNKWLAENGNRVTIIQRDSVFNGEGIHSARFITFIIWYRERE